MKCKSQPTEAQRRAWREKRYPQKRQFTPTSDGVDIDRVHRMREHTCRAAVIAYLSTMQGTGSQIARATGFARQTVLNEIGKLRDVGSPLLENLRDGRVGLPAKFVRPVVIPSSAPDTTRIVAQAIASRSALEEAWR